MLPEQTMEKLYAMKLNGLAEAYDEQRQQANIAELSFDDRLAMLVERQLRISVKVATCFGFKVATPGSVATLVWLGWVSGFFPSRV